MTFNRLSFEDIKGDDSNRIDRIETGVLREMTTPKFSVPFSTEGSYLWKRVDRNDTEGPAENRNELISLIGNYRALVIKEAHLFYSTDLTTINQSFTTEYRPEVTYISPETYII